MLRRIVIGVVLAASWLGTVAQHYAVPAVPDSIAEPSARADYVTRCFWENYDFRDTTLLRLGGMAEQAVADFLTLLPYASGDGQRQAVARWLDRAACTPRSYEFFAALADKYLADESSPLHSEPLHLLVSRHEPGYTAPNFSFTGADGQAQSLSRIARNRQTLLLFYDPDCERCRDLIFRLKHSSALNAAISDGRLQVLAVYTEENKGLWDQTKTDMPANWLTAMARSHLHDSYGYDLLTLPATYLLDANGRIVLRHPSLFALQSRF